MVSSTSAGRRTLLAKPRAALALASGCVRLSERKTCCRIILARDERWEEEMEVGSGEDVKLQKSPPHELVCPRWCNRPPAGC